MSASASSIAGFDRPQRGIALLLVLWMVVLLAVIAGSIGLSMRTETRLAGNLIDSAQAYALAEAGVYSAIMDLNNRTTDQQRPTDGRTYRWQFGDGEVQMAITDESGLIDLNTADRELLVGLLRGAPVEYFDGARAASSGGDDEQQSAAEETLEALADAIIDWRDADDARGTRGAEDNEYRAAGLDYAPSNSDFNSVDEVGEVLGMTPALVFYIRPALSVYLQQSGVNPLYAPRQVLLAIPGMDVDTVDGYLAQRALNLSDGLPPPRPPAQMQPYLSSEQGQVFSITADARPAAGGRAQITAVVSLDENGIRPYTLFAWREGERGGGRQATPGDPGSAAPKP